MKYRFCVTAYLYKEIEVEAENKDDAYHMMEHGEYECEFTADDIDDYERDYRMLNDDE